MDLDEVLLNEALIDRCERNYAAAASKAEEALKIDSDYQPARDLLTSIRNAADAKNHVANYGDTDGSSERGSE